MHFYSAIWCTFRLLLTYARQNAHSDGESDDEDALNEARALSLSMQQKPSAAAEAPVAATAPAHSERERMA